MQIKLINCLLIVIIKLPCNFQELKKDIKECFKK
jgi:hypothetical protein